MHENDDSNKCSSFADAVLSFRKSAVEMGTASRKTTKFREKVNDLGYGVVIPNGYDLSDGDGNDRELILSILEDHVSASAETPEQHHQFAGR